MNTIALTNTQVSIELRMRYYPSVHTEHNTNWPSVSIQTSCSVAAATLDSDFLRKIPRACARNHAENPTCVAINCGKAYVGARTAHQK